MQQDYKDFDWQGLLSKLPVKKTNEEREIRKKYWKQIDINGNGFVSLAELDKGLRDVLRIPSLFELKKVSMRAFQAAKTKYKSKSKHGDDYLDWMEFRIVLVYLRQYFEYYVMFCRIDKSDDFKVDINEFKKALGTLESWGVKITDAQAEFNKIDTNKGGVIMFDEFCEWAIKKQLDLEDDDDFDDEELKKMGK